MKKKNNNIKINKENTNFFFAKTTCHIFECLTVIKIKLYTNFKSLHFLHEGEQRMCISCRVASLVNSTNKY